MPRVSVLMPCYNAGRFVDQALASLIAQSYADYEVIVIDDGSTDNSREIIDSYCKRDSRIKLLRNEKNMGVSYTRNKTLELGTGEYIALMDADDIAPLNRLQIETDYLDTHSEIDVVSGSYTIIDEKNQDGAFVQLGELSHQAVKFKMIFLNVIANGSAMFRKDTLFRKKICYQDNYYGLEDYQFWCDMLEVAKIHVLKDNLQYYRVVDTGLSRTSARDDLQNRNYVFDRIHSKYIRECGLKISDADLKFLCQCLRESPNKMNDCNRKKFYKVLQSFAENNKDIEAGEYLADLCNKKILTGSFL